MKHVIKITLFTVGLAIYLLAEDEMKGEIKVVATKLTQTEQSSVSSVELIEKEHMDQFQIKNIEDISNMVSNINISGIGNRSDRTFSFRGVSNYAAYESSVAMFLDHVPIPMSYGYGAIDMNNVGFMEILKGPQSTLFGKNAESGVINIFTKNPSKSTEQEITIDLGSYNSKNFYGRVSGPLSENLLYGFSITSNSSDGYTTNSLTNADFDKRDLKSFSSKLQYNFNDNSDIKINYTKSKIDDGGSPFKLNTQDDPFDVSNEPIDDSMQMDNDLLSLIYTHRFNEFHFSSTTTYAKQDFIKKDYVGILGGLLLDFDVEIEEVTQEFKLNYFGENYDILAGVYFSDKFKFDYKEDQNLLAFNLNSTNNLQNTDNTKALFLQGRYWFNNNYAFSLGGRYQQITRDFTRDLTQFDTTHLKGSDVTTWNHFSPMASVSYFNDYGENIYFTVTQGYRPGGYNYREEGSKLIPYEEETTHSYELGYKKEVEEYDLEAALFYNDIKDLRVNTFDDNLATFTFNADKAYSYGFEGKLSYQGDRFKLFSTLGVTRAKIKKLDDNSTMESKNIIDIPQHTLSIGGKFNIDQNYYLQADMKHMGKRYYNIDNSKSLNSYTITNLSFGYEQKDKDLSLYVNNLFDNEYSDFMIATPSNSYYHFGKPRVVGVKLNKRF